MKKDGIGVEDKQNVGYKRNVGEVLNLADVGIGDKSIDERVKNVVGMKLGEMVKISKGRKYEEVSFELSKHRYINIEDLHGGKAEKYTNEDGVKVCEQDVLIAWDGANAGKVGVGFKGVIGSTIARLSPTIKEIDSRFLFWFLESRSDLIKSQRTGATIPHVNGQTLKNLDIPLPPLSIQQEIATLLDKADALRRKDRALLQAYEALAQAIFMDMFGDPVTNEKGWAVKTLRSIAIKITDGPFGSNLKTEHYTKEGIRVIRLANIGVNEFIEKGAVYISEEHYENVLKKYTCLVGDILIATLGEPNPRACEFPNYLDKAVNKADCLMLRVDEKICSQSFVSHLLNLPSFIESAQSKMHGQTRIRINMSQVAELLIPVPPLELQKEYSKAIGFIDRQQRLFLKAVTNSENLFQTLLQTSFK